MAINIMTSRYKTLISSVAWNLSLITVGALFFGIGLKAIAVQHELITGGISGVCLLIYYFTNSLSPGLWYLLINIPMFLIGWVYVSRRFFFYSLYGMAVAALVIDLVSFEIAIKDPFLAVLAGGALMGTGAGITFHSLGSIGGMDIVSIILNQKLGIRIGNFMFAFNMVLFAFSFTVLETDLVLYSLALSFVMSQVVDYVLTMSNQRKMVLIVSDHFESITLAIKDRLNRGATLLNGSGAYSGREKKVIMTIIPNIQLKRLEEAVLTIDPNAFVITENTFNVIGKGFSKRKVY